jgi:hypothetical protein
MKSRIRDSFLTLLGIAGLLVYVLACGPAFSPDGTKVAFPVIDNEAEQTSIVVYDIKKKTLDTVAVFKAAGKLSNDEKQAVLAYSVQWMPEGKQILINGNSLIMMLALGSKSPARTLTLNKEMEGGGIMPWPVIGNHSFLVYGNEKAAMLKLNLQSFETESFPIELESDEGSAPFSDGKQICLVRKIQQEEQNVYKILELNRENGAPTLLATLDEKQCGKLESFFWLKLQGNRFATSSLYQEAAHIAIIRDGSVEKMIPVGPKGRKIQIGNLALSPDEKSIFAAFIKKLDEAGTDQFGVMEVPLNGENTREIALFTEDLNKDENGELAFRIALSPDGRKIAASSLSFISDSELKPQDRALYLVDISRPQWKVTKIQVPLHAASIQAVGKK